MILIVVAAHGSLCLQIVIVALTKCQFLPSPGNTCWIFLKICRHDLNKP